MLSDVMKQFNLVKEFRQAGYFETEHHKQITKEIKFAIKFDKLVAISGMVGSGKTTVLRQIRDSLEKEKEVLISKS